MFGETVPVLLTVEEAGVLLRVGRTKAYAMAREWRETDGRSGLPVIDLGHVLRVPRRALEELIGADLADVAHPYQPEEATTPVLQAEPSKALPTETSAATPTRLAPTTPPTRRRQNRVANQLDFFDSQPSST